MVIPKFFEFLFYLYIDLAYGDFFMKNDCLKFKKNYGQVLKMQNVDQVFLCIIQALS